MMRLIWLINWIKDGRGFPCLFHFFTGLYCPGCGGTRAVLLLLEGNLIQSFIYHPFVLYMVLVLGLETVFWCRAFFQDDIRKKKEKTDRKLMGKSVYVQGFEKRYPCWTLAGTGIVGINWIIKNIFLLAGVDLLLPL